MNTTQKPELAKLAESPCDTILEDKFSHKYAENGLRENTKDVTLEFGLYFKKYSSYML